MEILIAVVVAVVVIIIISLFFLLRTGRKPLYPRPRVEDYHEEDIEPVPRPRETRREKPVKYSTGNSSDLTPYLIGGLRALVGLAALALLVFIYTSTQDAIKGVTDHVQVTRIYTEGIFKAVITAGAAAALYIFSRFVR